MNFNNRKLLKNKEFYSQVYEEQFNSEYKLFEAKDAIRKVCFLLNLQQELKYQWGFLTGPAASCIGYFVSGLTNVNPIEYDLKFVRYFNQNRSNIIPFGIELPDGLDLTNYNYIGEKYGFKLFHLFKGFRNPELKKDELHGDTYLMLDINEIDNYSFTNHFATRNGSKQVSNYSESELYKLNLQTIYIFRTNRVSAINKILNKIKIDNESLKNINYNDKEVFSEINRGGVGKYIDFSSNEAIDFLFDFKPSTISELCIFHSLNIVKRQNWYEEFLMIKSQPYTHMLQYDFIREITNETFGKILYQEQIIEILHRVMGVSFEDADNFRVALSRRSDKYYIENIKEKFIKNENMLSIDSIKLFEDIEGSILYSVCKAYTMKITYDLYLIAFLKLHYPREFEEMQNI